MEKRKILSVLLAVCMVLSLMPAGLVGAFALGDENDPIDLNIGPNSLDFENTDEYYCAFTPEESGPYVFAAESDMDSAVFLYDSEDNLIASADDWVNDDTTSRDFCLLALLEAEETYTLVITADTGDAGLSLQGENPYELTLMVVNVDFKPLVEGENEIIYDEENYNNTYYFVPEVSGDYSISSTESGSFEIYDETNNIITSYEDEEISISMAAGHIYVLTFSTDCEISIELSSAFLSLAPGKNTVTEITLDDDTGEYTYYTFTPEESGSYRFASVSVYGSDPYAYLYSLQKERLAENDDAQSEYSDNEYDFSLFYMLEAGKTYLLVFFNYEDLDPYDVYIEMINPTEIFLGSNELEEDDTLLSFTAETAGYYSFSIQLGEGGEMYDYRSSEYADYNTRMSRYMAAGESFVFEMVYGDLTEEDLNMVVSYSDSGYSLSMDESLGWGYLMFLDGYHYDILPGETVYFALSGDYTYPDLTLTVSGTENPCEYTLKTVGTRTVCSFVMPAGNVFISATPAQKDYYIATSVSDSDAVWVNSNSYANAGDTVFFEAGARNILFELDSITVSYLDENDEPVEVDYEDCGDHYSFVMPAADVSIYAAHKVADIPDVPAFTLGENTIDASAGTDGVFTFTPEESGTYTIISAINSDPKAYLYDDLKKQIDSNDDGGSGYDFRIKQYLDAGKTYYLYIKDLDGYSIAGTVTIRQASAAETVSHALVLSGEIGVIFNIYIDEDIVDAEGSYIEFSTGRFGTQRVYTEDTLEMYSNDFDIYYRPFVCYLGAYRMADEITPVFHWFDGDEEVIVELEPYSAQDYINYVSGHSEEYGVNEYRLVEAINDYGYYSQQYLSNLHGYTVGDDGKYAAVENCFTVEYDYAEIKSDLSSDGFDNYTLNKDAEKVEKVTFSLNLESTIDIYLYITVKDGVVPTEVECNGIVDEDLAVLTQYSENVYRVVIKDIKLSYLADYYNIVVKDADDNELISAELSPMNYAYLVLDRYSDDADKADFCKAICALAVCRDAIEAFINNQEPVQPLEP